MDAIMSILIKSTVEFKLNCIYRKPYSILKITEKEKNTQLTLALM